jgi:hypothetical protein
MAHRRPTDRASPGYASLRSRGRDAIAPAYPLRRQSVRFPQIAVNERPNRRQRQRTGPAGSTPSLPRSIRRAPGREAHPAGLMARQCLMHRTRPLAATSFNAHNYSAHLATRPSHSAPKRTGDRTTGDVAPHQASERRKESPFGCTIPARPWRLAGRGFPDRCTHPGGIALPATGSCQDASVTRATGTGAGANTHRFRA